MLIKTPHDGYSRDGRRIYPKGGDPGADARQQEAERQARIKAATDQINRVFGGQVKSQAKRYVAPETTIMQTMAANAMGGEGGADGQFATRRAAQTLTPEEFAQKKAQYDAVIAKQNAPAAGGRSTAFRGNDRSPFSSMNPDQAGVQLTAEEQALLASFDPSAFKEQTYDTWADGDPANSRQALYDETKDTVYKLNSMEVDRQAADAARATKFGLARSGLAGGSADIDAKAEINRRTNEGLLRAGGIADQTAADLKAADERTRGSLISMAQSGIDTGSAATLALEGLKSNAQSVAGAKSGATIGGLFNDLSAAYLQNQGMAGRGAMQQPGQQWYGVSSPTDTYSGSTAK